MRCWQLEFLQGSYLLIAMQGGIMEVRVSMDGSNVEILKGSEQVELGKMQYVFLNLV